MSTGQPTWEEKIKRLRTEYSNLQDEIAMEDVTKKLGDVATEITGLPGEIEGIRKRGYVFAGYLEHKTQVLFEQWDEIRQQVRHMAAQEMERIQNQFDETRDLWQKLDSQWSDEGREKLHNQIQDRMAQVREAANAARARIEGMYGQVPANVAQTRSQIRTIATYLDRAEETSMSWEPTEAVYMVMEAEWVETGKGKKDPDGMLYLTDRRLIFEQKEKVGGRLGFGGEKVQEVLWAVPVGAIAKVKAEDKGLLGRKDMIHLKLSTGDYAELTLEVKESGVDSKWYAQQLNRVITGEIEKERAVPVDAATVEAVSAAPTACTTCGATLPPITRGMTEMTCEYCGTVVRI